MSEENFYCITELFLLRCLFVFFYRHGLETHSKPKSCWDIFDRLNRLTWSFHTKINKAIKITHRLDKKRDTLLPT